MLAQRHVDAARAGELGERGVEHRGSGQLRNAIAASWLNGLASAATARIPWPMARRAVQPVPAQGSRTVSPEAAKAASSASSTLSAGGGR